MPAATHSYSGDIRPLFLSNSLGHVYSSRQTTYEVNDCNFVEFVLWTYFVLFYLAYSCLPCWVWDTLNLVLVQFCWINSCFMSLKYYCKWRKASCNVVVHPHLTNCTLNYTCSTSTLSMMLGCDRVLLMWYYVTDGEILPWFTTGRGYPLSCCQQYSLCQSYGLLVA